MKKLSILFFLTIILTNCTNSPDSYISSINGYWEIESVTLSNGTQRDYKISGTIDFISINDSLKGFRKKVKPLFDGTFKTSKDKELLDLKIENDSLNIYYKTPFNTWKETVLFANEKQLKIVNQNNDVYLYKRFTPIKIE